VSLVTAELLQTFGFALTVRADAGREKGEVGVCRLVRLEAAQSSGEAAFGGAGAFVDDELPWTR
jgi:hypothetical protein